ncbi:MAG: hypothetical protein HY236_04820 [Acidobacteria bacterium]|nr:hypothetical protein [Acidobacteriota bacterium]
MMRPAVLALLALVVFPGRVRPIEKEDLLSKYRDKFVVVINEGMSTGVCQGHPGRKGLLGWETPTINIIVKGPGPGDIQTKSLLLAPPGCGNITPEPTHKGEVLKVSHVAFHAGYLQLSVENISAHSITRGVGAFGHESLEKGSAFIRLRAGNDGKDLDAAHALSAHWFRVFDTADEASRFGNTASGVFVRQVKAGMSFAEVEEALGVPQARVDLGERVLYKYKDMAIEFHDGKVVDVR